ncbi:MAG: hypothetical protein EOM20_16955 [Spartobacteria bacterium]|nr:hypothetical protein [Spartobacteria bacterium]
MFVYNQVNSNDMKMLCENEGSLCENGYTPARRQFAARLRVTTCWEAGYGNVKNVARKMQVNGPDQKGVLYGRTMKQESDYVY